MENINQVLILELIKANLRNNKLIYGLEKSGLVIENFYTNLERTILRLIGFTDAQRTDELYEYYDTVLNRILCIETNEFHERLNELCLEMYAELLRRKLEMGV